MNLYNELMETISSKYTYCLTHHRIEDQMSSIGLVCECCKKKLNADPPEGKCMSFWESQPGAYSQNREPCFIYTLIWDNFRIRSLHPPESVEDSRSANRYTEKTNKQNFEGPFWLKDFQNRDNFDPDS